MKEKYKDRYLSDLEIEALHLLHYHEELDNKTKVDQLISIMHGPERDMITMFRPGQGIFEMHTYMIKQILYNNQAAITQAKINRFINEE